MIIRADARNIPLPDNSVQCVVTSPPYWGLRKYAGEQELTWGGMEGCGHEWGAQLVSRHRGKVGDNSTLEGGPQAGAETRIGECHQGTVCRLCGAWRGAYGLEPTIEMYVAHSIEILREARRVLRDDGVLFLNIGDSYFGGGNNRGISSPLSDKQASNRGATGQCADLHSQFTIHNSELKPKNLCLIPARIALAAQADGWWVRSDIIWAKPNPMPESCRDRPTDAYEHILMLTKSERYFWDAEAVKEPVAPSTITRVALAESREGEAKNQSIDAQAYKRCESARVSRDTFKDPRDHLVVKPSGSGRNLRNVWTFATQPYKGAHFATFPEELVRRCLAAATSERGACPQCRKPWERVIERTGHVNRREPAHAPFSCPTKTDSSGWAPLTRATDNWRSGCACAAGEPVPCVVLDCFGGSGTTGEVAYKMGRRFVLLDLAYQELQKARIPPMAFAASLN